MDYQKKKLIEMTKVVIRSEDLDNYPNLYARDSNNFFQISSLETIFIQILISCAWPVNPSS